MSPARVIELAGVTASRQLVILSGAGASMEHPTHAPSGVDLMTEALCDYFVDGLAAELQAAYQAIQRATSIPDSLFAGRPRLEAVLDVVASEHGADSLASLTTHFVGRPSNRIHRMLAAHLSEGGRQLTANFDSFIENVSVAPQSATPHHFHGQIRSASDALPFGAFLRGIEHGFDEAGKRDLLAPIIAPETRAILWIGYSFSDYFDVTPALLSAIAQGALDGKTLVWLSHANGEPTAVPFDPTDQDSVPAVLRLASERGVDVVKIVGRSGDALYAMLESLGCKLKTADETPESCTCARSERSGPHILPVLRRAATVELLRRFGLLGRLGRPGCTLDITPAELPGGARDAYFWKRGEYRQGYAAALSELPSGDGLEKARLLLLGSRFDWIRGRLVRAGRRCVRAIRLLDAAPQSPPDLVAEALERFGRICVAMRRSPDTRFVALPFLRLMLFDYRERAARVVSSPQRVSAVQLAHLQDALVGMAAEVDQVSAESRARAATSRREVQIRFSESERVDSFVDYLRGNANSGEVWPFPLKADESWQSAMRALYDVVGNRADRCRLDLFVPDSAVTFSDAICAALTLDVTPYQRLRMLVLNAIKRRSLRKQGLTARAEPTGATPGAPQCERQTRKARVFS